MEQAYSLIPGAHRLYLHASYGEFDNPVDRDQIEPRQRLRFSGEALFRVESGLTLRRVQYPAALALRRMADENFHGLRLADPREPLELLRNDLPLLNEVRRHV